ncbi:urease accessory protein UreD [Hyphococcus lacteus]|uniref:Urease accessory protein UreD n=1 Tax=Hyphococcus lacteus TaxID=3143536 RepID=A0ABV3Z4F3_9PROT
MQCNADLQRTTGHGELVAQYSGAKTSVSRLSQTGAAKIRFPKQSTPTPLTGVLINTAGGMTGGDKFEWSIAARSQSSLSVSTQACEKIYRAGDGYAEISIDLSVEADAHLHWLPQETILYDGSYLKRKLSLKLGENATALIVESIIFGRREFGETNPSAKLEDCWRVFSGTTLVHAEQIKIDTEKNHWLSQSATANGLTAFATILLVSPNSVEYSKPVNALLQSLQNPKQNFWGASSFWAVNDCDKLTIRMAAVDGYQLRKGLSAMIALLSNEDHPPTLWLT